MKINPKPPVFPDIEELSHRMDEHFLKVVKPLVITSPYMVFFYCLRAVMLVFFWYAAIYVLFHMLWLLAVAGGNILLFVAIYMSVVFNCFYQTFDFFDKIRNDIAFHDKYVKTKEKYDAYERKIKK